MKKKTDSICRAVDIAKTYWLGKVAVEALRGVSLDIERNDYVSIMGASGSGKSTLVHILSCLDTPTSRLSALDNVALPLIYRNVSKHERIAKAKEIIDSVGLADRMYHRPNELSGGECQRVAIARALVNDPKVIYADEPTGNLDSKTGAEIMEIFDRLVDEGNTVVMVTHDMNVAAHARRTVKLRDGQIIDD
jgi:putative ABC transport system ATP-binding protein